MFLKFSALFLVKVLLIHNSAQSLVDNKCLGCICEAASGCNFDRYCEGDVCGPFRMTWGYWFDSGKPTVNGEIPDSGTAYQNCAHDISCCARAIEGYMTRYQKDCNYDGVINCQDFALIHNLGPFACFGQLRPDFAQRYNQCASIENL